jgi:hypothetical protein
MTLPRALIRLVAVLALLAPCPPTLPAPGPSRAAADDPRASSHAEIRVVDAETGRGVPLVELVTVNHLRFVTDNAGRVAFDVARATCRRAASCSASWAV